MAPELHSISRLCVLTTGRQDWGILRSTCALLRSADWADLRLVAGGMACQARFGGVDRLIEAEGFELAGRLDWITDDVTPGTPLEAARALAAVGAALERQRADALILVGDRYETLAAATAATMLRVPIVHLHGGEETEGAFDNAIRHAITKLAHLHLASRPEYARAIERMGEDPASIHVVGAPGLDNLHRTDLASRSELEAFLGIDLKAPVVVVTVQPSTLALDALEVAEAVCAGIDAVPATYVITLPNSDPGHDAIRERLRRAATRRGVVACEALGERRYWGLLRMASAVLGNSSSGVIEAPALGLPTVNVGDRQKGRIRSESILDVPADGAAVTKALLEVLSPGFRERLSVAPTNPSSAPAAAAIGRVLSHWQPPNPPIKSPLK